MSEWKKVRIGDVCTIEKGATGIASATPGKYPMVTTGAERKTCANFQFDADAVCIPLVSSTGHGKKTLNYVHYQSGKFALGTILAAVIPKKPDELSARFLHLYLHHFKNSVLVPLMKGAANVSLPMKGIADVNVPLPPVAQQLSTVDLVCRLENEHAELAEENANQLTLLKQLRQAILQEAVEGKLTADWRKKNPVRKGDPEFDAGALMERIRAEKERMVEEGKIGREKPLAPIEKEERPLEVPVGWVWIKLENLGYLVGGGTPSTSNPAYWDGDVPWVCPKDMKVDTISDSIDKITMLGVQNSSTRLVPKLSVLFVVRGMILAHTFPVAVNDREVSLNQDMKAIVLPMVEMSYYVKLMLDGSSKRILQLTNTSTHGTKRLEYAASYGNMPFPLPPLAEQRAIVARVDSLMSTLDELETQISSRKSQSEMLMQSVLREAFEGGRGG